MINKNYLKKHKPLLVSFILTLSLVAVTNKQAFSDNLKKLDDSFFKSQDSNSQHNNHTKKHLKIAASVATGFNRLYNRPITTLGSYGTFGYETSGVYNPDSNTPLPLTESTNKNLKVATVLDNNFLTSHGLGPIEQIPQEIINVPLRDVGMNGFVDGISFQSRPSELEHQSYLPFTPSQKAYHSEILVGDWLKANGKLEFVCQENGSARIHMRLSELIPERLYTVWAFFDTGESMPFGNFGPVRPLAGLPNIIISDEQGRGEFKRILNFCPMNLKNDEVPLLAVFVNYHSDIEHHGAALSFTYFNRYPGTVTHTQLFFPLTYSLTH